MSFTARECQLRQAAAKPAFARLEKAIAELTTAHHKAAVRAIRDNLFEVDWTAEKLKNLSLDDRETLERALGAPISDAIRDARNETAENLLEHAELTIERVGELVGYSTAPAFTRNFQGWSGAPPAEWRRVLRLLPGLVASSGAQMTSLGFALRAKRHQLSAPERRALFRRVWSILVKYCADLRGEPLIAAERRLATEIVESRLVPEPGERHVDLCRRFFKTRALADALRDRSKP